MQSLSEDVDYTVKYESKLTIYKDITLKQTDTVCLDMDNVFRRR